MTFQSKILGTKAESLAANLLKAKKLQILKTNLRTKFGEVDILARDGQTLVIVEVKAKSSSRFGRALEMISQAKQRKLVLLALALQQEYNTENTRIDVVAVDDAAIKPKLKHYRGIVEYHG